MRSTDLIFWFRVFVVVTAFLWVAAFVFPLLSALLPFFGVVTTALGLLVISEMALSLQRLNEIFEMTLTAAEKEISAAQKRSPKDPSEVLLDMASYKRLGDRVFKADGTKTCRNCKSLKTDDLVCQLDGVSLQGITVSAVGCQHWQPALKVTESPEPPTPNGNQRRSFPSPPPQEA